jgi:uncharacterized DUF497 family protein
MHVADGGFSLGELEFTWDAAKNLTNTRKHGVAFEEAATTWLDDLAIEVFDEEHSTDEDRWIRLGRSLRGVLVVTWWTVRSERGEVIRIIGARRATRTEKRLYEAYR